ncbi:hypothetical protein YPPY36_2843, partial [Yersinia pestis PY-36]
MNYNAVMNYRP